MSASAERPFAKSPETAIASSRLLVTAIWQVSAPGQRVTSAKRPVHYAERFLDREQIDDVDPARIPGYTP
jgi:hypothetical protein